MFIQPLAPVGGSLVLSALVAAIPLIVLFVLLGVFKVAAWIASLSTLVVTAVLAVAVWTMPAMTATAAATEGLFFGLCQIMWILISAVWMYNLTVKLGWNNVLGDLLRGITSDLRILAILIAFCFGALLEALAGFGTPVAITAAMLVAAGMKPIKSAVVCLVANTAPVAFGAMGAPITALGASSLGVFNSSAYTSAAVNLPVAADTLARTYGAMAGRMSPFMALFVPLFLVFLVDGMRGLKDTWGVALASGAIFAVAQFLTSNYIGYEITDVVASVACILGLVLILRFYKPKNPVIAEHLADTSNSPASRATGAARVWGAVAPYVIVVVLFSISQIPTVKAWLTKTLTKLIYWPTLQQGAFPRNAEGKIIAQAADSGWCGIITQAQHANAAQLTSCNLGQVNLYSVLATGTILFIGGLITMLVYKMSPATGAKVFGSTLKSLRFTIVTIACVLSIAYVLNGSGMTITLGTALAAAGGVFAIVSPVLGWLGVAITGSDTSSNALFGGMQVTAAHHVWPGSAEHAVLAATTNSTGGVMGKMISPQSLSVAAAAASMPNQEGEIFRRVVGWSILMLAVFCVLVVLEATVFIGIVPIP